MPDADGTPSREDGADLYLLECSRPAELRRGGAVCRELTWLSMTSLPRNRIAIGYVQGRGPYTTSAGGGSACVELCSR